MGQGQSVQEFKQITFVWESTTAAQVLIYTDLPGGAMTLQQTITLPSSAGIRTERTYPLSPTAGGKMRGRLISLQALVLGVGVTYCILLEGWVHAKKIGVYLDGAMGDQWEFPANSLGG